MSLPVLVAIVVVGIALCVLAVHVRGGGRLASIADAAVALDRFAVDHPDDRVLSTRITRDRRTAFLELEAGRIGIVHAMGDCYLTRLVSARDIMAAVRPAPEIIALRFDDFTWRGGTFTFASTADAQGVWNAVSPPPALEEEA